MAILENFSIFSNDSENWENFLRQKFCERNAVKLGQKEVCSCFEGLKPSKQEKFAGIEYHRLVFSSKYKVTGYITQFTNQGGG